MNELNVFNNIWSPWKYPSNWIRNTRMFFRQFKWAYQRITRGYSDPDYWDMDVHLSKLIAQMLRKLAQDGMGYPGNEEFPTYESWANHLNEIASLLEYSNSELPNEYEEAWLNTWDEKDFLKTINEEQSPEDKEITQKYLDKEVDNDKLKEAATQKALKMIAHIFRNLWD